MDNYYVFDGAFSRILHNDFCVDDIIDFFNNTDVGETILEYEEQAAYPFILNYGNENIVLNNKEKNIVRSISKCCTMVNNDDIRIFIIDFNYTNGKPYFECAAIIKIFNLLFRDKDNLFLFLANEMIAIGTKRSFSSKMKNNFCISDFYSYQEVDMAYEFFNSCCFSIQEIADNILFTSKIEKGSYDYDSYNNNKDSYFDSLQMVISSINDQFDSESEEKEFRFVINEHESEEISISYNLLANELNDFGEEREEQTAFEVLQMAKQSVRNDIGNDSKSYIPTNDLFGFSEEELADPELLLKKINNIG